MNFVPNREELAWAAGFFDGEGCFSYSPASRYVCVSIGQTERDPLNRFRNAVGLGKVNGPYDNRRPGRLTKKPQYFYQAYGYEKVQAIAAMLWFWLGSTKRDQAHRVLSRAIVCARGHAKVPGHKDCAICQTNYWRARRNGTLFEDAIRYQVPTLPIHVSAETPTVASTF
jgi:hypothetical protein